MSDDIKNKQEQESQSQYIRILSHQLKSPINSIQSLLNTISEGFTGETNPKTLYFIEKAVLRIDEAKEIITDLLDYELYSQSQSIEREELDINVLVNSFAEKYIPFAAEKDISLHIDIPLARKIFVPGDSRGLNHAFKNLIENAIKYTPPQGEVTVQLSVLEGYQVCLIEISDTGYGVPKDELEHIFEPFYRSIKHKSNIPGTGLGLAIVKRIISGHNGTIRVTSHENTGTTFTVALPYSKIEDSEQELAERKKVVIIGGTTAGPKVAARLRRLDEDLDITIIEKAEFLSYSGCGLPLYITNKVHSSRALMSTADNNIRDVNRFESIENIKILNNTVALQIEREKQIVRTQNLKNKTSANIPYDILVLATGSELIVPKIPGIWQKGVYSLHNLEQAEAIKTELTQHHAQDICIIGGGLIGTSTAENLVEPGLRVTILEQKPHILFNLMDRNIALKIQNELRKKGIKIITGANITKIERRQGQLMIETEQRTYYADLIILATGVKPNSILAAKAGLEITKNGGIQVSPSLQTSDEHIYAAGDCAESVNLITQSHEYWPLGSVSTKMGKIVADQICDRPSDFQGSIGTAMFKIVDIHVARTGLTLRSAREHGFDAEAVIVTGLDRAHYYAHARHIVLKVIADRKTHAILGAQGYGKGDVISKIQLLATAITQSLTLNDVFKIDLGYAPAYNTPVDIVQTACLVLKNKIEDLFRTITIDNFEQEKDTVKGIVDVSPFSEHSLHSIPGSINIPLENIRLEDIPFGKDADVILYSNTSSGAYKAYRYLVSKGYTHLRVLEGGYIFWEQ